MTGKITDHFYWQEANCKDGCEMPDNVKVNVMKLADILELIRIAFNLLAREIIHTTKDMPLIITSWYRHSDPDSAHSTGLAVDIACSNNVIRYLLVRACIQCGINRVFVYHGSHHIHIDIDDTDPIKRPPNQLGAL